MVKSPALYPVVTTVRCTLQLYVSDVRLKCCKIETGESEHSKTKSAIARLITNVPWIVFLTFLSLTMIRTNMFPTSPMMNTVMITATSVHHCKFFSIAGLKESWSMRPFCESFLPRTYSPYKCHVFSAAATLTNLRIYHYYITITTITTVLRPQNKLRNKSGNDTICE